MNEDTLMLPKQGNQQGSICIAGFAVSWIYQRTYNLHSDCVWWTYLG